MLDHPARLRCHRLIPVALNRVHLGNDPRRLRLHHLRPVVEIDLVAVVVRRIMARCEHDPRRRVRVAHRERKLRRRARQREQADIHPVLARHLRRQLREMPRKMPRIVRDHNLGPPRQPLLRKPLLQIRHQPLRRPRDIEIVHCIRPHARELRAIQRLQRPVFRGSHDLADRPPAQPARPESQRPEKPVIQLPPSLRLHQFRHARQINRRTRASQQLADIARAGFQQLSRRHRGLNAISKSIHGLMAVECRRAA